MRHDSFSFIYVYIKLLEPFQGLIWYFNFETTKINFKEIHKAKYVIKQGIAICEDEGMKLCR